MENNIGIDIIISVMCLSITLILFYLFFKKKINIIELIVYSYSSQTFYIAFVSKTISAFFFVSYFFMFYEIYLIIKRKLRINLKILILLTLPIFSSFITCLLILLGVKVFGDTNPSFFRILFNAFFFYIKYFMPIIFLGVAVSRAFRSSSIDEFIKPFKRVVLFSCCLAILQLILTKLTGNVYLLRLFGVREEFLEYTAAGFESTNSRISALFIEPKALAYFIAISFPFLIYKKNIFYYAIALIVGIFTASQTFFVGLVLIFIVFYLLRFVKNIRANIIGALFILLLLFFGVSYNKQNIYNFYTANRSNSTLQFIFSRAIDRYDIDDLQESNQVLGMPLQRDMELPIFKYFNDNSYLYIIGYGLKNGGYVPLSYFPSGTEKTRTIGTLTYTLNMRWFYFITEFGIVIFILWLLFFTKMEFFTKCSLFEIKYYSFLLAFLFLIDIEIIIILFFGYIYGRNKYNLH